MGKITGHEYPLPALVDSQQFSLHLLRNLLLPPTSRTLPAGSPQLRHNSQQLTIHSSQLHFVLVHTGLVGLVDEAAAVGAVGAIDAGL